MFISSFDSVDQTNDYLKDKLQHPQIIHINSLEKFYCLKTIDINHLYLKQLASQEVSEIDFNTTIKLTMISTGDLASYSELYESAYDKKTYVYPWSKTTYRRSIHQYVPDSLYKKLYNLLKDTGYISGATGNYVVIVPSDLAKENFDSSFSIYSTFTDKNIQNILNHLQETVNDQSYYTQLVESLEERIAELEIENKNLLVQVTNKSLTTWY